MSMSVNPQSELFSTATVTQYGSHMIMSDVYKPTKHKYIHIDTQYCDNYRATNQGATLMLTLPERITNVKSIEIENIEVPQSFFNIYNLKENNSFKLISVDTNEEMVIVLPDNQYTIDTLVAELNNQVDMESLAFSKLDNMYIQLTNTTGGDYIIDFSVLSTGSVDKYNIKHKLGWILGFRSAKYTITDTSTIVGESIVNLIGTKYLYLVIDDFSKGVENTFITNSNKQQIIAKVILNKQIYPFGSILPASPANGLLMSDVRKYSGNTQLHKLSIQLLDDCGLVVDLNQIDFSFCIKVCYE